MVTVSYRGSYTARQLTEIEELARKTLGRGSSKRATGCFGFAAAVLLALALFQAGRGNSSGAVEWALLAVLPVLITFWNIRMVRASRNSMLDSEFFGELSTEALRYNSQHARTEFSWDAFPAAHCSPEYILLLGKGQSLIALPATFFASVDDFCGACGMVPASPPLQPKAGLVEWRNVARLMLLMLAIMAAIAIWWALSRTA